MADYIIKGETLTGIAEVIRSKTGGTDPIKVTDMAAQIGSITAGGSVEGVHYVTFMNHDGTVEAGRIPVAEGYDCPAPKFDAPIKESDAQYDYTFVGWATTPNGAWDENALKDVTEDRTVYAAYAASVRVYTITFYDDDGTTVLTTKQVAYGATPSYVPDAKDGYIFERWTPDIVAVTGDASYQAVWTDALKITDDWATISARARAGTASQYYQVGATKEIALTYTDGTSETLEVAIAGFNIHRNESGTKDGITFILKGRPTGKTVVYSGSVDNVVYAALPDDLKAVIQKSKISAYTAYNTVTDTTPYLFLPESTNFAPFSELLSANGTTQISSGISGYYLTEYRNTYDADVFPVFDGVSQEAIVEFLGIGGDSFQSVITRSFGYVKISGTSTVSNGVTICHNSTKTLFKGKGYDGNFTFCFRV